MNFFNISNKKSGKGFTLVEMIVVIAIIGILSTIVLASVSTARKKARVAKRVSDMKQVQAALEFYYAANHSYPSTSGVWRGTCANWGSYTANNVIPGLAPTYIAAVPTDPQSGITADTCYMYNSDGVNYSFIDNQIPEMFAGQSAPNYMSYPELVDPARDGGSNLCIVDGNSPTAWKVNTPGNLCW